MKLIKNLFLISLISFFLLEISLAVYSTIVQPKIELPIYSFDNTQGFWFDLNKDFGTWHLPNHSYRQKKTCFDVTYHSNENGFRDKPRSKSSSEKRVHVIGDSFIEGVGVGTVKRLSNLLEKETGVEHLNFGLAGNFGPTQYALLYEKMARQFDHEAIVIGILPANDFIDDDLVMNQKMGSQRYKPYWQGSYPSYKLTYFQDSLYKSNVNQQDLKPFKKIFKNFTYTYNFLLYLKTKWKSNRVVEDKKYSQSTIPSYFTFSQEQLNKLKYSLLYLKSYSEGKKILVFTIPTASEIRDFKKTNENPLGKEMIQFCIKYEIEYLDLLEESKELKKEEIEELFLVCDGHWSNKGNQFAMEKILHSFSFYSE